MVYVGLEFGSWFEIPWDSPCYQAIRGVNPVLQIIFTFSQMYFVFMNSRVSEQYKPPALQQHPQFLTLIPIIYPGTIQSVANFPHKSLDFLHIGGERSKTFSFFSSTFTSSNVLLGLV